MLYETIYMMELEAFDKDVSLSAIFMAESEVLVIETYGEDFSWSACA